MNHRLAIIRTRFATGVTAWLAIAIVATTTGASEGGWQPDPSWPLQDPAVNSIELDVLRLGSDSYATRQASAQRLIDAGRRGTLALQSALSSDSLDLRTEARLLLRKIHDRDVDRELDRLLALDSDGGTSRLPLWAPFRNWVGDDWRSRRIYCELVNRYRESITALSGDTLCGYRPPSPSRLDPLRLDCGDRIGWMMVLFVDLAMDQSPRVIHSTSSMMPSVRMPADRLPTKFLASKTAWESPKSAGHPSRYLSQSARLAMALTQATSGPTLSHRKTASQHFGDEELRRLIGTWVSERRTRVNERDRLSIAMRYQCLEQAAEICKWILNQATSDPHSIAAALLSMAAMDEPSLMEQLSRFESDRRIAQHWHMPGTPGVLVQTQIRDVVLALRLRQQGIDPRIVGFRELMADPTYIYRENSLGFCSNDERDRCCQAANSLLSGL